MQYLLIQLIQSFFTDSTGYANELLLDFFNIAFKADEVIGNMGIGGFSAVFKLFLDFGLYLIVLKFLKKGFDQYVLWIDADPDADPLGLLVNFVKAMFVALCFGEMYNWLLSIIKWATDETLTKLGLMSTLSITDIILNAATLGLFAICLKVIFFIIYIILLIDTIKRGLEMIVLRAGIPIAASGLIDSDGGVFRTYLQKFYQSAITVFLQIVMVKIGLVLMTNAHLLYGIAALIMAKGTPKFLQEFVIFPSSGGGLSTVYQTARLGQMAKQINWAKLAGRA